MRGYIKTLFLFVGLVITFLSAACSSSNTGLPSRPGTSEVKPPNLDASQKTNFQQAKILTVYAAASLTDAFREIGTAFEAHQPGVKIHFSFAGSQVLRTQLEQGAMADVFASADQMNMDVLVKEKLVDTDAYGDFASNRLVVIIPPGNTAGVKELKDLAEPGLKIILADESVPVGEYAREMLFNMSKDPTYGGDFSTSVLRNVVSNETDVRQVVAKVELGEADAGIVYISDAVANPRVTKITIPDTLNIVARYPIAVMRNSPNIELSRAFIDFVMSADGQTILHKWGFSPGQ